MTSLPPSRFFPPAEYADSEGVVGFGGKLTSEWLLDAYQHGIFPWPTGDPSLPVPWCSPDPRAIFELDRFHVPRRLAQTCRSGKFRVTCGQRFFRRDSRLCHLWRASRSNVAHDADDSGVYPTLRRGTLPQRGSLARRSLGRGNLRFGNRGAVRRGIDVPSASATPRRWPWSISLSGFVSGGTCSWISNSLPPTPHNLGLWKSRVLSICGDWQRPSTLPPPSATAGKASS